MRANYVQDWTQDDKNVLLYQIMAVSKISEPIDVCVAGSYVYGVITEESDLDVLIYIPDEIKRPASHNTEFDGIHVSINYQHHPAEWRRRLSKGRYLLSVYSLKTSELHQGVREEEIAYMQERGISV